MNHAEKAAIVDDVARRFADAPFVALIKYDGSTVAQMDEVRRSCEALGIHFQVVKNTLSKRAISGTEKEALAPKFTGPLAVLFSGEDPIAAAKLVKDTLKKNDRLEVRAGFFEGTVLDAKGVEATASLPSREQLLVSLLRTLQEGPRQVLGVIRAPARDLLSLLKNYETKLEEI